ncbi:MAG TPA: anaerobic ribonucleoside-triphosphate reductase activating protein [Victivallales bacterium]|nr:anaerobic ribonucleoside-triphosphate reductase activating protein [Victivallales bacterium]
MNIRGLDKFSLIDYPGGIAAIIFTANCNFRCPYCHNPHLVLESSAQPRIAEKTVLSFLDSRVGKIDAVVISGGEPTLQKNLPIFLAKVKERGFHVKLDSNGSRLEKLKELFDSGLLDSVALDYKAPRRKYDQVAASKDSDIGDKVAESVRICVEADKLIELRTTVHKRFLSYEDLTEMRDELNELGAKLWVLQQFHRADMINQSLEDEETYSDAELANFARSIPNTRARGVKGIFFE